MTHKLTAIVIALVCLAAAAVGYQFLRARVAADIYRDRLTVLHDDYDQLRQRYNQAVSKTAVTELVVDHDRISVVVRNAAGQTQTIPTPYTADHEIFVDYAVLDGRLVIRRVFDDQTPPSQGVKVDPDLVNVDWGRAGATMGKAAYRRLGEGRWVVTVTGDGSLGLARTSGEVPLNYAPALHKYEPVQQRADAQVRDIGPMDVLKKLWK